MTPPPPTNVVPRSGERKHWSLDVGSEEGRTRTRDKNGSAAGNSAPVPALPTYKGAYLIEYPGMRDPGSGVLETAEIQSDPKHNKDDVSNSGAFAPASGTIA